MSIKTTISRERSNVLKIIDEDKEEADGEGDNMNM